MSHTVIVHDMVLVCSASPLSSLGVDVLHHQHTELAMQCCYNTLGEGVRRGESVIWFNCMRRNTCITICYMWVWPQPIHAGMYMCTSRPTCIVGFTFRGGAVWREVWLSPFMYTSRLRGGAGWWVVKGLMGFGE